jgi:uncharacterized protein (DUF2252 family)
MQCVPGSNRVYPLPEFKLRFGSNFGKGRFLNMERPTDIAKDSITRDPEHVAHIVAPEARVAAGKALRDKIPREQHGRWNEIKGRKDAIDLLRESDVGRMKKLIPIRYGRMLPSPFTFYRGAAGVMAADLARTPTTGLRVQACGDCHLVNFGGFATPERNIIFDINDFDETAPGPWEWDVKRLVASIVLAARSNGLSDHQGRDCAVSCARSYREQMREFARMDPLAIWYAQIKASDFIESLPKALQRRARKRFEKAASRSGSELDFPKLAGSVAGHIRITDQPPLIFHTRRASAPEAEATLEQLFHAYRESLNEDRRMLLDRYRLVDVAIKVVGIGSVGRRCWIVLMMSEGNHPLFLQFKEAVSSVLEPYAGKCAYDHHGQRVVSGQRLMQPASDIFLGWVTGANGRQFYVRQLRDAKIKPLVETFNAEMLDAYAQACGWVLARAHAKASEVSGTISGYLGSSNDAFDNAMGKFALTYADQAERDHAALRAAVRRGEIAVIKDA